MHGDGASVFAGKKFGRTAELKKPDEVIEQLGVFSILLYLWFVHSIYILIFISEAEKHVRKLIGQGTHFCFHIHLLGIVYLIGNCAKKDITSSLWRFYRISGRYNALWFFRHYVCRIL